MDFEESGVDQQTLHDLREVSTIFSYLYTCPVLSKSLVWMISPKAGMVEVVREAVLMGEHRLMSLPFICPGLTRLGAFRPPRLLDYLIQAANYYLYRPGNTSFLL